MYYVIIAVIITVDQLVKHIVQSNMQLNDTIPLVDGIFHLTYIHNYGAAFSILENKQVFLLILTGVVILGILIYMTVKRKTTPRLVMLSFALIVGGGAGNLVDRALRGYVVDFFDFRIWPIFNVADIAVVCGCILMVFYIVVVEPRQQKQMAARKQENRIGDADGK